MSRNLSPEEKRDLVRGSRALLESGPSTRTLDDMCGACPGKTCCSSAWTSITARCWRQSPNSRRPMRTATELESQGRV